MYAPIRRGAGNGEHPVKTRISMAAGALLLILHGMAQAQAPQASSDAEPDAARYNQLRRDFVARPGYNSTRAMIEERNLSQQAKAEWAQGHEEQTIAKIRQLLDAYPYSILGHAMMRDTYTELAKYYKDKNPERQQAYLQQRGLYDARLERLVQSVTMGTACASYQDHCKVISINEEYMVLRQEKLQRQQQAVQFHDGVPFDVLTAKNQAGEERALYFDISLLNEKLGNAK